MGWYDTDLHAEIATTSDRSALEVGKNNAADGALITLRKQGAVVGSIGVDNSDNIVIEGNSSHSGLQFATNLIYPHKNGAIVDNTIALGGPSYRFTTLSLSDTVTTAGVLFGSDTAAANTLDDYEEGTATFTFTCGSGTATIDSSNDQGSYVKIGKICHVQARLGISSVSSPSSTFTINGLPYAGAASSIHDGETTGVGTCYIENAGTAISSPFVFKTNGTGTTLLLRNSGTTSTGGSLAGSIDADTKIMFQITYRTNA